MKKVILIVILFSLTVILWPDEILDQEPESADSLSTAKPVVTFLEFGSTTCVPCKMMEKVMEEIRTDYGEEVEVIFHNVNEEKDLSAEYGIKMIPTQIFLDSEGNEFHRHIGYYPLEEIAKIFSDKGIEKK